MTGSGTRLGESCDSLLFCVGEDQPADVLSDVGSDGIPDSSIAL
jgi:hypothetical protein